MPSTKPINYSKLSQELEEILTYLQSQDTDVDKATKSYERGMEIIEMLETYIKQAENKVQKVKSAHS